MKLPPPLQNLFHQIYKRFSSPLSYARHLGVNIGADNYIPDKDIWSSEPYLITVGNHCQITRGVKLFTHGGAHILRKEHPDFDIFGKIVIGDYVYIGNNSLIMPGVTIGNNVLVAAGSVVTKSIPDGVVVGGNPARIICTVEDYQNRNLNYNIKTKGKTRKEKEQILFNTPDSMFVQKGIMRK